MRPTRFPSRADGPGDRVAGFVAHLRLNGFRLGPGDTGDALAALAAVDAADPAEARAALKVTLVPDRDRWEGFDALYDAYWYNAGATRERTAQAPHIRTQTARPTLWRPHLDGPQTDGGDGDSDDTRQPDVPAEDDETEADGTDGRLIATRTQNLAKRDLRALTDEADRRAAEAAALRLARALRDRLSRRRRAATRGRALDMRRVLRASLATGGEPIRLFRRHRPDRPMQLHVLCDVSGSMTLHARVFLAFVKGLVGAADTTEAYLFHTRLMRVTPALRDHDTLRAAGRLSLMAQGFGGGTDIAGALAAFTAQSGRALGSRSLVLILSDGYCAGAPDALGTALAALARRAGRLVWLTPVPPAADGAVARHMAAVRPRVHGLYRAASVADLAALEPEFACL
ncbi:MAG: VWA domain-containing protein [Pseudomonadota bacterium]